MLKHRCHAYREASIDASALLPFSPKESREEYYEGPKIWVPPYASAHVVVLPFFIPPRTSLVWQPSRSTPPAPLVLPLLSIIIFQSHPSLATPTTLDPPLQPTHAAFLFNAHSSVHSREGIAELAIPTGTGDIVVVYLRENSLITV
ncbi:hypothetical protein B296_00024074 [Ensete ventricosum]|uniref:Uncharacterized protein n=1 Tax=Ensete ventricosum TaxID=4639 RepID=A0A426YFV2_ENSVE|nr:hypothetical protein B296_00024074 [Ensete ventricosum]